jgi:hypothetical protein
MAKSILEIESPFSGIKIMKLLSSKSRNNRTNVDFSVLSSQHHRTKAEQ